MCHTVKCSHPMPLPSRVPATYALALHKANALPLARARPHRRTHPPRGGLAPKNPGGRTPQSHSLWQRTRPSAHFPFCAEHVQGTDHQLWTCTVVHGLSWNIRINFSGEYLRYSYEELFKEMRRISASLDLKIPGHLPQRESWGRARNTIYTCILGPLVFLPTEMQTLSGIEVYSFAVKVYPNAQPDICCHSRFLSRVIPCSTTNRSHS